MKGWNFNSGGLVGWWQTAGQKTKQLIEGLLVQVPGQASQKVPKVEIIVKSNVRDATFHIQKACQTL